MISGTPWYFLCNAYMELYNVGIVKIKIHTQKSLLKETDELC